jgi:transcriptional regulator with XRE-family HTH domain
MLSIFLVLSSESAFREVLDKRWANCYHLGQQDNTSSPGTDATNSTAIGDEQMNTIGQRIRQARQARGLTQRELAAIAGISIAVVYNHELGNSLDPMTSSLRKIAIVLNVPLGYLLPDPDPAISRIQYMLGLIAIHHFCELPHNPVPRALPDSSGGRVREARIRKGLGLNDFARSIGMAPSTLSNIETGKVRMNRSALVKISAGLDMPPVQLLYPRAGEAADPATDDGAAGQDCRAYNEDLASATIAGLI